MLSTLRRITSLSQACQVLPSSVPRPSSLRFASSLHKLPDDATRESILEVVHANPNDYVKFGFTDVDGVMRGKYVSKEKFTQIAESDNLSLGFCNVVFGWDIQDKTYDARVQYTGNHTGYPDAEAMVQLETFRTLPWENDVPFFLLEFHRNKDYLPVCPRSLLRSVLDDANDLGLAVSSGMEFEWFNFDETAKSLHEGDFNRPEPLTPGMHGYSTLRTGQNSDFFHDILNNCTDMDIELEGVHTETGPGVYEAAIKYTKGLESADRGALFKHVTKMTASKHNFTACFMAKWSEQLPGSSGHIHQSLWTADGKAAFYDAADENNMSDTFKHYVAGQIKCIPHILPMYAPNINSFKRQVPGFWAPMRASWAVDNRTVAIRALPGSEKSTRVETRIGGADVNPYFNLAASVAAGLYGIKHKLPLDAPVSGTDDRGLGNPESHLPSDLKSASIKMRESELAKELFGEEFVDHFTATRLWENEQWQKAVTDWELKRYCELV